MRNMQALWVAGPASLVGRVGKLAILFAAAGAVAGCVGGGGPGGPVAYTPQGLAAPDLQSQPVADSSAPIGVFDQLAINVFQVESLSGEFKVDSSGKIDYPLIGSIQAQGRTVEELREQIAKGLGEKYLRSPNVSVQIKERATFARSGWPKLPIR
jgi:polysaccharide export outer membrane protein